MFVVCWTCDICLSGQLVLAISRFVRITKTVREYMASRVRLPPLAILYGHMLRVKMSVTFLVYKL